MPEIVSSSAPTDHVDDADIAFAELMIPHDQRAIEMAAIVLAKDTRPQLEKLAGDILAAQDPEIQRMRRWLSRWGVPDHMIDSRKAATEDEGHEAGEVTMLGMGPEVMNGLLRAQGSDFQSLWLRKMIKHHEEAITMADEVLSTTEDPQVARFATATVDVRSREIMRMRFLLSK